MATTTAKPRVGIIGNGHVGTALHEGLGKAGYRVQAVGKDPKKVREIAQNSDVIVLAVPFAERANALREMGDAVAGKTLVDVTNALTDSGEYAADIRKSGAEELQEQAKTARVVKAFNTIFAQNMAEGKANGERLTLFAASDDPTAKQQTLVLGRDLGFDPVDAGPLKSARWLETLGILNINLGYGQKMGPDIGFRLVHRQTAPGGEAPTESEEAAEPPTQG